MAKKITQISFAKPSIKLKRVAAYARVSVDNDAMAHSLSAQVSHYSEMIQSNPKWQYIGVYADEAKTGTKENREQFQQLIQDCRDSKIDMVITKSISRFARNTVVLLETVRELKLLGVDVFFEEQNIHTTSSDGELMLTILASYAQEESLSSSENIKWRIRHGYEKGELLQVHFLFGYDINKSEITINDEKAAIVREVFQRVISGESYRAIAKDLNERHIKTELGNVWVGHRIVEMITNEKYTGNALMQKTFVNNHIDKKVVQNTGELPMYYIEDSHPAIIGMETFEKAKAEVQKRHEMYSNNRKPWEKSIFSGKIKCMNCGCNYKRITVNGHPKYHCGTFHQRGKRFCTNSKAIPEETLMDVTASVLGLDTFDSSIFKSEIDHMEIPLPNHIVYYFKSGEVIEHTWKDRSRRESWTPEMREKARQKALSKGAGK